MATHSSVLAWRIPGMGEPGELPSMGLHRFAHDWSDLGAAVTEEDLETSSGWVSESPFSTQDNWTSTNKGTPSDQEDTHPVVPLISSLHSTHLPWILFKPAPEPILHKFNHVPGQPLRMLFRRVGTAWWGCSYLTSPSWPSAGEAKPSWSEPSLCKSLRDTVPLDPGLSSIMTFSFPLPLNIVRGRETLMVTKTCLPGSGNLESVKLRRGSHKEQPALGKSVILQSGGWHNSGNPDRKHCTVSWWN